MRVELWMASDLSRLPDVALSGYAHRLAFFYEDDESPNALAAAERAWRITNGAINRLEGGDLELRLQFESVAPGQALSVGDKVKFGEATLVCESVGFSAPK